MGAEMSPVVHLGHVSGKQIQDATAEPAPTDVTSTKQICVEQAWGEGWTSERMFSGNSFQL